MNAAPYSSVPALGLTLAASLPARDPLPTPGNGASIQTAFDAHPGPLVIPPAGSCETEAPMRITTDGSGLVDDSWRVETLRMADNFFHPGEKGVSNLPSNPEADE